MRLTVSPCGWIRFELTPFQRWFSRAEKEEYIKKATRSCIVERIEKHRTCDTLNQKRWGTAGILYTSSYLIRLLRNRPEWPTLSFILIRSSDFLFLICVCIHILRRKNRSSPIRLLIFCVPVYLKA